MKPKEEVQTQYQEHTDEHPFCGDMDHGCHEDQENMAMIGQWTVDGLVSLEDVARIFRGETF